MKPLKIAPYAEEVKNFDALDDRLKER